MGRAFGAGIACLFQMVVIGGYCVVAVVLGSAIMVVAPLVAALLVILWVVVQTRLEGQ